MLNRGLDKQELLRIVDSVANEKSIDKELILSSMESAIQKAAYSKFGFDNEIEATIDREKGSIKIQKVLNIVEKVEDASKEILLNPRPNLITAPLIPPSLIIRLLPTPIGKISTSFGSSFKKSTRS